VAEIALEGVRKVYGDGTVAIKSLDLVMPDGSLTVLVGPSGCGKSTLLQVIAGLEPVTEGRTLIGGRPVNPLPPQDRDIAMVFQNYALYPHMTAYQNMAFGLRLRRTPRREIRARVGEAAEILGLTDELNKKPRQLSGGQRQRVAMGRAIVRKPQAFLMDEPLSNLDAKLRVQMRAEISRIQRDLGVTMIYVTHDQVEALTLGDRVAVLSDGDLQQVGSPEDLYERPANVFVAGFIGSPTMNIVPATLLERDNAIVASTPGFSVQLGQATLEGRSPLRSYIGSPVLLGMRPEHFEDAEFAQDGAAACTFPATVDLREVAGSDVYLYLHLPALDSSEPATLVARTTTRSRAREGDRIEIAVDTSSVHLFDPESGASIDAGSGLVGRDPRSGK
jgi:multiple sugar transport system ATP-binding protein